MMKAELEKVVNSAIFPGIQGGPLDARHRRQGGGLQGSAVARVQDLRRAGRARTPMCWRRRWSQRGLRIVSGRTESHVMLVDLRAKGITGKEAEAVLGQAHITVNKNAIPNDPEKPFVTSGVRLGTPAMTTRGFKEAEAELTGQPDRRRAGQPARATRRLPCAQARQRTDGPLPGLRLTPADSPGRAWGLPTMRCPFCSTVDTQVIDSRVSEEGDTIRRRRRCTACDRRFTTYERVELSCLPWSSAMEAVRIRHRQAARQPEPGIAQAAGQHRRRGRRRRPYAGSACRSAACAKSIQDIWANLS